MKLLQKIKSIFKKDNGCEEEFCEIEIFLMDAEQMAILAESVYADVKKNIKKHGIRMNNETEKFIHTIFLRGYYACYTHFREMIDGQLSVDEMINQIRNKERE